MPFEPIAPRDHVEPRAIAPETFLVHQVQEATGAPLSVYINSLVIRGREPVVVDTGTVANRKQWLDDVFGLVDPSDVRWVFLSHDDVDHTGNLAEVLTQCPQATLVASWAIVERMTSVFDFPLERMHWINDGETFAAGDRELLALRPPVWDSPTTRGLFDATTGVYWAADCFATVMTSVVDDVAELDPNFWREGMTLGAFALLAPWLTLADPTRFATVVDRTRQLGASVIAGAHTPSITGSSIEAALATVAAWPNVEPPATPDQEVLDAMRAAIG